MTLSDMSMTTTEAQLKRIHVKLQLLMKQHVLLEKENNQLKVELQTARQQASLHQAHVDNLKQQVDVLKYTNGELNGADKKDFEKKINSYLKEIDKCIAMLSQ
jgi:hypothetical protein